MKKQTGKSKYLFYGAPEYDPRPENRTFVKCKDLQEIEGKVLSFVKRAVRGGAKVIELKGPDKSSKKGRAELYSDAGLGKRTEKKRGILERLGLRSPHP
jgi:hypothetical protein